MSQELVISTELQKSFPTLVEGLRKAQGIFEAIKSFEDIERVFLKGAGLSPNTYRSYIQAVRDFYRDTDGLNPLQVTPADIESWYDTLCKRVDRNTARLRVAGLKRFFAGIRNVIPFYTSPFEIMSEKLHAKLNRTRKGNRTKKAMTKAEFKRLLAWLETDTSTIGRENYAIVYMLGTSGLRASELCQLTWTTIELHEGKWTAVFTGKGDTDAEQELYGPAVEACRAYFRRQFRRDPRPADALFWTVPTVGDTTAVPLAYHTLWRRVADLGKRARAAGIVTRQLQFSPHLFRRTYATMLYKGGMGLKGIQGKTRHANIEVLTRHYISDDEAATPYLAAALA